MEEMTITTAKYLAELFHEGQTRADKVTPYIEHPKMVAEFVEKFGGDDEAIALAWVHDILEESADKVAAIEKAIADLNALKGETVIDREKWLEAEGALEAALVSAGLPSAVPAVPSDLSVLPDGAPWRSSLPWPSPRGTHRRP